MICVLTTFKLKKELVSQDLTSVNPKEIVPGLFQIELPIPIESLRSVFAYFAFDGKDNLLIDTGWQGANSKKALEAALEVIGFSLRDIQTVVVSHLHPDHFGLAEDIKDSAPNSKLIMHRSDASWILNSREEYERFMKELHDWLGLHGTPKDQLEAMYLASLKMLSFFRPPKPNIVADGGEIVKVGEKWRFELIHTPGHTAGNICLYDNQSKVLFSGDHILPTITPNISLSPRYNGNPLGDYLDSLSHLKSLDAGIVLPSHEHSFSNLRKRIEEIEEHHKARLEETMAIVKRSPKTAFECAELLSWNSGVWESLSPWERRAALMETLAHLRYLELSGRLLEFEQSEGRSRRIHFRVR